jgi:hypothetical protein
MLDIVKELKEVIKEKQISPEAASRFIGASGRSVRRWVDGEAKPNLLGRQAIRRGIRRIQRML